MKTLEERFIALGQGKTLKVEGGHHKTIAIVEGKLVAHEYDGAGVADPLAFLEEDLDFKVLAPVEEVKEEAEKKPESDVPGMSNVSK